MLAKHPNINNNHKPGRHLKGKNLSTLLIIYYAWRERRLIMASDLKKKLTKYIYT